VRYIAVRPGGDAFTKYYLFCDSQLVDRNGKPTLPDWMRGGACYLNGKPAQDLREQLQTEMEHAGVLHVVSHGDLCEDFEQVLLPRSEGGESCYLIDREDYRRGELFRDARSPVVVMDCCYSAYNDNLAKTFVTTGNSKLFVGNLHKAGAGQNGSASAGAFAKALLSDGLPLWRCLQAARTALGGQGGIMQYIAVAYISDYVPMEAEVADLLGYIRPPAGRRWALAALITASFFVAMILAAIGLRELGILAGASRADILAYGGIAGFVSAAVFWAADRLLDLGIFQEK
jgi:hypothetical protein